MSCIIAPWSSRVHQIVALWFPYPKVSEHFTFCSNGSASWHIGKKGNYITNLVSYTESDWATWKEGLINFNLLFFWINQKCWARRTSWTVKWICKAGEPAGTQHTVVRRRRKICLQQRTNSNCSPRDGCEKETFLLSAWRVICIAKSYRRLLSW